MPCKKATRLLLLVESTAKSRKSYRTSLNTGASATISSVMPVNCEALNGIEHSGFTNEENSSVTFESTTFIADISTTLSLVQDVPVVSKSKTT